MRFIVLLLCLFLSGCFLVKDNEPKPTVDALGGIQDRVPIYRQGVWSELDDYGLVVMDDSVGDSALFSCLAYSAGAIKIDPYIFFTPDGRPLRHPNIYSKESFEGKFTTVSRDMVNGILWCLYTLSKVDEERALDALTGMIEYGRAHKDPSTSLWTFCTEEDRKKYNITSKSWFGKCVMTPTIIKDIYRLATSIGFHCDAKCKASMTIGVNTPTVLDGYQGHLNVITTLRNGLIEGSINDVSLNMLKEYTEKSPRNGLFSAVYHLYGDGDQTRTMKILDDATKFPRDHLPTAMNYCTDYLYQRDDLPKDWSPCPEEGDIKGQGVEWLFAEFAMRSETKN